MICNTHFIYNQTYGVQYTLNTHQYILYTMHITPHFCTRVFKYNETFTQDRSLISRISIYNTQTHMLTQHTFFHTCTRDFNYDETFSPDGSLIALSVWIPLTDARADNGCMYILPKEFDSLHDDPKNPSHLRCAVDGQGDGVLELRFPLQGMCVYVRACMLACTYLCKWIAHGYIYIYIYTYIHTYIHILGMHANHILMCMYYIRMSYSLIYLNMKQTDIHTQF